MKTTSLCYWSIFRERLNKDCSAVQRFIPGPSSHWSVYPPTQIIRMERQNKSSPSYILILFDFFFYLKSIAVVIIMPTTESQSSPEKCVFKRKGGGDSPGVTASAIIFCVGASGDQWFQRGFLYIWCWRQAGRGGVTQHAQSQSQISTGWFDLSPVVAF